MSLNHSISIYDSPLNEEPEQYDDYHDHPYNNDAQATTYPFRSIQQRMYVILGVATVAVIIFGIFVVPFLLHSLNSTFATADGLTSSVNRLQSDSSQALMGEAKLISPIFSPEVQYWAPKITAWAKAENLDPDMVATVMQIESCGDPNAISSAGAQGLFQVMPYHFEPGENSMNPDTNAFRGMRYLSERLVQTQGDVGKAFAGYNGGHVAAGSDYSSWANETQRYFRWSTTIYADAQAGLTHSPALDEWLQAGGASLCNQAAASLNLR